MRPLLLGLALWSLTFAACGVDEDSDAEDSGSDVADVDAGSDDTGDDGSTSDDSDGSGDLGDVADWTPPEPRDPDEPPAVEPHESRPATLLFHVEDEAGAAVQGTAIDVFGRSVLTDARGDARLERLPTGEYIVGLRKSGYAEQVRTVELSRGSVTRLVFTLRARPEAVTFDAADGGTVAHSDLSLEFGPDAFIDVRGQRYDGVVSVTLTAFGADAESLLAFPAPLVAEDSAGETTYLETLGAFDVSVLGEDGQPLALAGDERVTARLALPADSERALGDLVPMWSLDPTTALWHEEAGVVAEVVEGDGGQSLWVELPHVSVWNFDTKAAQSCYWIHIRNADNFLGAVELEVIGPGYRRRAVVQDFDINVVRVPPGPTTAILYIGGVELDRIDFIAVPVTDGNCPEYELFARDAIDLGGGGGRIIVGVTAGNCPAPGLLLEIAPVGDAPLHSEPMTAHLAEVVGLTPGDWTLSLFDPEDGARGVPLDAVTVTIDDTCATETCDWQHHALHVPPRFGAIPPGGCVRPPCQGDECHSCVIAEVADAAGDPAHSVYVSMYDPVFRAHATGLDGSFCEDIDDGADIELLLTPHGGVPAAAVLPRSASCENGGCARRRFTVATETLLCPGGATHRRGTGRLMDFLHPGYTGDGQYPPTPTGVATAFSIDGTGDAGFVDWVEEDPTFYLNQTFGFRRVSQDPLGVEWPERTVIRTKLTDQIGLSFEFGPEAALGPGTHNVGAAGQTVDVVVDWFPSTDPPDHYSAVGGSVEVIERTSNTIWLGYELQLSPVGDTAAGDAEIDGTIFATISAQADTRRLTSTQRSHYQNGGAVYIVSEDAPDGVSYGPAGQFAVDPDFPLGELQYCVPNSGWHMLVGEPVPGMVLPFTALQEVRDGSVFLYGNDADDAWLYTTFKARWFSREYIELLYASNGRDLGEIEAGATILGRAFRGEDPIVNGLSEVYLEHPSGRIDGEFLADDFSVTDDPSGGVFVFFAVPPQPPDDPYTLHLIDLEGAEVLEYAQQIAPIAGGVMVTHN